MYVVDALKEVLELAKLKHELDEEHARQLVVRPTMRLNRQREAIEIVTREIKIIFEAG